MPGILLACAFAAAMPFPLKGGTTVPTETVIRLTVQPMAAPRPALRYSLLPELRELSPGNPIPNYIKCFLDRTDSTDQEEILGPAVLRQVDRAARLDKPDWQLQTKMKTEGYGLLLPDVQKIRALAAALQTRFREELAQQRFDDALVTAKTMFAMSRHTGEHPTLIGNLVGMAIAFVAITPLEEMLEQPGCPNLYWALTNLPNPLVSLDKGLDGERMMFRTEFRDLDDTAPMSQDQIRKAIAHIDLLRAMESSKDYKKTRIWLAERVRDDAQVKAARGRIVEGGIPAERALRFPPEQVLLLDELREHEVLRDDRMKYLKLSTWDVEKMIARPEPTRDPILFDFALAAITKVRRAQGRLEQRVALLRHVEALRMYAASHDGKLPERLSDTDVPLPPDPFTGKPFLYRVEGQTAHLRGSPPKGEEKNPAYNLHYEITIRK